jgi:hypothetical protein
MLQRAVILVALLGQILPPVVCARCCWMLSPPAPAAAEAPERCPCCPADDEENDAPAPAREGPQAPTCPLNPQRHLVAWSHDSPGVDFDAAAPPAAPPEGVILPELSDIEFDCILRNPDADIDTPIAPPLRC